MSFLVIAHISKHYDITYRGYSCFQAEPTTFLSQFFINNVHFHLHVPQRAFKSIIKFN